MTAQIQVRALGENDWAEYRELRLSALRESPEAFVAEHDEELALAEDVWRERMRRSRRFVADRGGQAVGIVSVRDWPDSDDGDGFAELFGLWVRAEARGSGAATALVRAAAEVAQAAGSRSLSYWVFTDNARAVGFASGFGFLPSEHRRPRRAGGEDGDEELAMVLPLG